MPNSDSPIATDPSLEEEEEDDDDDPEEEEVEEVEEEDEEEQAEEEEIEEIEEVEEEEEEEIEVEEEEELEEEEEEVEVEEEEEEDVEVEEEEEEEVEVEEEEEEEWEEEEVEVEEEEEKEEEAVEVEEEDKVVVPNSLPDADKDHRDSIQHMESEGQGEYLGPVSSVAENPGVMQPSHYMEENDAMRKASVPSYEALTLKKEEFHPTQEISIHPKSRENLISAEDVKSQGLDVDVENAGSLLERKTSGGCSEPGCNSKASLSDVKDIDSRAAKSSSDMGKNVVNELLPRDCFVEDADGGQISKNKIMESEMESRVDVKQMTSRRTRSLSPSAETKDGNKRPTIICDFFAKGWCIRGSSCSFLHIKDTVNNTDQEAEGDLVTAHQKRELKLEEGVKENAERSRTNEEEASPSWHPSHEKEKFPVRDSLFPENRFAFNASNNYFSPHLSSYSSRAEGMAAIRNQPMYKGYRSTVLSQSPNSSVVSQLPAASMSLSHRIFPQSGCSLPYSSSLGASTLDSQRLLNSEKEYHASKSTFSVSGREDLALIGSSRVPPHSAGYKSKIRSYDWEPSVPFRPSFFITSMNVSSPGDLYDPLRDSIEIPNIGDGSLKASLLIQGSSIQASSQVRTYGDSAVVGKHMSDLNDDKSSVSSYNRFNENEPNRSCVPHEKDCLATETEIASGTRVNYQNGKVGVGHTFGVEDTAKTEKKRTEHDARHHGEGSGRKKKRVGKDKKIHETDFDFQTDGSVQKETKALRNFRATLVDLVKELLKPSWHEGRLSKDAHILIVKKSVDKVVSTLEPHQIPTTEDTAKQYVSSCRVKIAKLVNGYVNKYGKS